MFWKNEYSYQIIDDNVTDENLRVCLKENGINLDLVDNSTRWCAFAQYYGLKNGFDLIKSTSFSYIVSLFMAGMGVSAGTEMYFKEEQLELDLIDSLNLIKSESSEEEEQVQNMFFKIFKLYSEDIAKYEYATQSLSLKLTPSEMEKFQSVEGEGNKNKFKYLLNLI